jgi:hypothetical protein
MLRRYVSYWRSGPGLERLCVVDLQAAEGVALLDMSTPVDPYPEQAISFIVDQYVIGGGGRHDDVRAAVGELLANAVIHGNERDAQKEITTSCAWTNGFYVGVRDEGGGFDVDHPPFVMGRSGKPPEGGMGLKVVRQRSDLLYTDGSAVICAFRN